MKYLLYYEGKGRILNILDSTTKKEVDNIRVDFGEKVGHGGCGYPYELEEFYKKELEGIYYSADGHNVRLFIFPENTKEQIDNAKEYIRKSFDVVHLGTIRIEKWI